MEPSTIAAFTNPEILIGTFGYLLLKDKATVAKVRARWQMEPHVFISVHF